jgi:hypothetical protein
MIWPGNWDLPDVALAAGIVVMVGYLIVAWRKGWPVK